METHYQSIPVLHSFQMKADYENVNIFV